LLPPLVQVVVLYWSYSLLFPEKVLPLFRFCPLLFEI